MSTMNLPLEPKKTVQKKRSFYRGDPNVHRPFKCDQCDKAFRRRFTLQEHKKIHTGEKPFVCPEPGCTSRFSTSGNLSRHKKVHLTNRYKCTFPGCELAFSTHSILTKHIKTHAGDPPYSCPVPGCNKIFTSAGNLMRHTKTHKKNELSGQRSMTTASMDNINDGLKYRYNNTINLKRDREPSELERFPQIPRLHALPNIENLEQSKYVPSTYSFQAQDILTNGPSGFPDFGNYDFDPQYTSNFGAGLRILSPLRLNRTGGCYESPIIPTLGFPPTTLPRTDGRQEDYAPHPDTQMSVSSIGPGLDKLLYCAEEEMLGYPPTHTKPQNYDSEANAFASSCFSFELDSTSSTTRTNETAAQVA